MPSRTRKLLTTTAVVGATCAVAGLGVFAAFTATTENTGNSIASGTVQIGNNGVGPALYSVGNLGPGAQTQRCIRVNYTGTLPATVKLYRSGTAVTNGSAFNVQVERGSGVTDGFPGCTGFTAAPGGGVVYNGSLGAFPTTYALGPDARGAAWAQGDNVWYRFTVTVVDDPTPGAHTTPLSSGSHNWTWEARNN